MRRKIIILCILFLLILSSSAAGSFYFFNKNLSYSGNSLLESNNNNEEEQSKVIIKERYEGNAHPQWYGIWKPLSDLKLISFYMQDHLTNPEILDKYPVKYFAIGKNGEREIIIALSISTEGPGSEMYSLIYFFEKDKNGNYSFMSGNSDKLTTKEDGYPSWQLTGDNITSNNTILYSGIEGPLKLTVDELELEDNLFPVNQNKPNIWTTLQLNNLGINPEDAGVYKDAKRTVVYSTQEGELIALVSYMTDKPEEKVAGFKGFYEQTYVFKSASGFYNKYSIKNPFQQSNDNMQTSKPVKWHDGNETSDWYVPDVSPFDCDDHSGSYGIYNDDLSDQVMMTGAIKEPNGVQIYELKDKQHPIYKYYYGFALDMLGGGVNGFESYEKWVTEHPVIFIKMNNGKYFTMLNISNNAVGECGKPVIYLYPEKTMRVDVEVGAKVDVSIPNYAGGWSVIAQSDGTLTNNDGKKYENLFWEGTGYGDYPKIASGKVVELAHVKDTMITDLYKLGLNEKETADFIEYWMEKMPNTKYVRLTWFNTEEMNRLAPLNISPKPQTLIRVFLDFEGLDHFINLPKQNLEKKSRNGFTVVEWGGLLR